MTRVFLWSVLLIAGLGAGLASCSKPLTTEQRIIADIRQMEAEIEDGERAAFLDHFTEDFEGQGGVVNHDRVKAMVIFQLNRYENLQAQLFPFRVTQTGEFTAQAAFRALVTGGDGLIPKNGQVFDFVTQWRLVDNDWLLYAADWTPVALDEVL